ncbi:hypothetical protein [uncultured Eubacterium sp.]|uniref:hypothetical protein n=1 Tax=uncultured Eubacterium sp. TaxID=165185 RepID=UPI0025934E8C|nr:hypothetical protein [uncultured Eubacterium sp.]
MIQVAGKNGKSIIAEAIQKYNGAIIYSYYNEELPFENCWCVNPDEYSVKKFCEGITVNIKEEVKRNENLPLSMVVIYTNLSDIKDVATLLTCASRLENVEKLVNTVVVMTR